MKQLLLIIPFVYFLACQSCNNPSEWESSLSISPTELHAKQGDCLKFKDFLNRYFLGTIMNFHKSKDGIRYAMCFNNYYDSVISNKISCDSILFSGRKVMYYTPKQYTIGFDITWVRDSVIDLNSKGVFCNIDLASVKNIEISSEGNAMNFKQFSYHFHLSKNDRQLPPDDYWDMKKEHLRTDEYFTLKQINDWYKKFQKEIKLSHGL